MALPVEPYCCSNASSEKIVDDGEGITAAVPREGHPPRTNSVTSPHSSCPDLILAYSSSGTKENGRDTPGHDVFFVEVEVYEHPLVPPQVSHFRQVPFRTIVKLPHSEQLSPS